jgi:hypothetical protein
MPVSRNGFHVQGKRRSKEATSLIVEAVDSVRSHTKDRGLREAAMGPAQTHRRGCFTEWTADGSIRHPSFQGLREDKQAKDVVREVPHTVATKNRKLARTAQTRK